jgi:hypothetical protein
MIALLSHCPSPIHYVFQQISVQLLSGVTAPPSGLVESDIFEMLRAHLLPNQRWTFRLVPCPRRRRFQQYFNPRRKIRPGSAAMATPLGWGEGRDRGVTPDFPR